VPSRIRPVAVGSASEISEHSSTMTSSDSEGKAPSRKRSRASNSAEDGAKDGKKARGRPRVDTQDATAADVSCFHLYVI
jgi:hypothetical protein